MNKTRKIAFIYPGQGAQYVGMGRDIAEQYESAAAIYRAATAALGLNMEALIFNSDEETLKITENTQPALLTTCVASTQPLLEAGILPEVAAGLSIGEYAAHVIAGTLTFEDAVRSVKLRGRFMQEEVPVGKGGMAAIMGLDAEAVERCCREAETAVAATDVQNKGFIVEPVNFNCPGQIVVAGNTETVEAAAALCGQNGAKKATILTVSAPFHSSLMRGAGEKLDRAFEDITFHKMNIPVVSNVTAAYIDTTEQVRDLLVRQVYSAVKWEQCVRAMLDKGIDTFVEIGPGKTLAGFIKRIDKEVPVYRVGDSESLESTVNALKA